MLGTLTRSQFNTRILAFTALRVYALRAHWFLPSVVLLLYGVSIGIDLVMPLFLFDLGDNGALMSKW